MRAVGLLLPAIIGAHYFRPKSTKFDLHQNRFGPVGSGRPTTSSQNRPKSTCTKIDSCPSGAVGLLLPVKTAQNRLRPSRVGRSPRTRGCAAGRPQLRHSAPGRSQPAVPPRQQRPMAGPKQVDGSATVHDWHRSAARSTEVAATNPGPRHWTPPVAPWCLSTSPTGGRQARRPAQPRPGLYQPP